MQNVVQNCIFFFFNCSITRVTAIVKIFLPFFCKTVMIYFVKDLVTKNHEMDINESLAAVAYFWYSGLDVTDYTVDNILVTTRKIESAAFLGVYYRPR